MKSVLKTFFISVLFFYFAYGASAEIVKPVFHFTVPADKIAPQSDFQVVLYLDSDLPLNVIDLTIGYPENLTVTGFDTKNSIINFWQEQPSVKGSEIILTGGLLKGFVGRYGDILKINFFAKAEGEVNLTLGKSIVYLANGLGTNLTAYFLPSPFQITIAGQRMAGPAQDKTQPILTAATVQNPADNQRLLVFTASDIGSGIKESDVRYVKWFAWSGWQPAKSPFVLPRSVWLAQLKTTDFSGNAVTENVYVKEAIFEKLAYFVVFAAVIILLVFLFKKRLKQGIKEVV